MAQKQEEVQIESLHPRCGKSEPNIKVIGSFFEGLEFKLGDTFAITHYVDENTLFVVAPICNLQGPVLVTPYFKNKQITCNSAMFTYLQCPEKIIVDMDKKLEQVIEWKKLKLLGGGGDGFVFQGSLPKGENVAVKQVRMTCKEYEILNQISHPNIINYLTHGIDEKDKNIMNIFLELAPGGSVANLLKNGSLNEIIVAHYLKQLLKALVYLHEKRIIHRDIKCANLLIDCNGDLRLADFSLAQQIRADSQGLAGTYPYLAPECVKKQTYGEKSDIWALGCVGVEMLTGSPPFKENGIYMLLKNIVELPPTLPNGVSTECNDFLTLCLNKDPNMRLSSLELLNHPYITKNIIKYLV